MFSRLNNNKERDGEQVAKTVERQRGAGGRVASAYRDKRDGLIVAGDPVEISTVSKGQTEPEVSGGEVIGNH